MYSALSPYLHFKNSAREAMSFYQTVFGGKVDLMTFGDQNPQHDPAEKDLIMHAMLTTENGIVFMASDTPSHMSYEPGNTITMALNGDHEAALTGYFNKLADGGKVEVPLAKAPWGDSFGMLIDKFGIEWMVNILAQR